MVAPTKHETFCFWAGLLRIANQWGSQHYLLGPSHSAWSLGKHEPFCCFLGGLWRIAKTANKSHFQWAKSHYLLGPRYAKGNTILSDCRFRIFWIFRFPSALPFLPSSFLAITAHSITPSSAQLLPFILLELPHCRPISKGKEGDFVQAVEESWEQPACEPFLER